MKPLYTATCNHEVGACNHWDLLDRIAELEAEVEGLKSFIRRIADTPERSATAERLFEALERVA